MMFRSMMLVLLLLTAAVASAQIKGQVMDSVNAELLPGATIKLLDANQFVLATTLSNPEGRFQLNAHSKGVYLQVSYMGYLNKSIDLKADEVAYRIGLTPNPNMLQQVTISTGYQKLSAERSTGSFIQLGEAQINRRVGSDLLSRLEDQVPGLIFHRDAGAAKSPISIRGQSTIFSNTDPLIVVDNFPYDGALTTINPNDVESITVLKDAAAASIWGARAGNGVIVVTTKKGRYSQPLNISANMNTSITQKADAFAVPVMSSEDYLANEQLLFSKGFYKTQENAATRAALSPAVELMMAQRDGQLTMEELKNQLDVWGRQDVRKDFDRYYYQQSVSQQYALNLTGGTDLQRYYLSAGWDNNRAGLKGNATNRLSLTASGNYLLLNKKLELSTGVAITYGQSDLSNPGPSAITSVSGTLYSYARLADDEGRSLSIMKYRPMVLSSAAQQGLLNWEYQPLEDLTQNTNVINSSYYRLDAGLSYQVMQGLKVKLQYQYGRGSDEGRNHQSQDSYAVRDLINRFTIVNADGSRSLPVPLGGILTQSHTLALTHNLRGQLDYDLAKGDYRIHAFAGGEVKKFNTQGSTFRMYGYDPEHAGLKPVDYVKGYTSYINPTSTNNIIPNVDDLTNLTDRYISYFSNAALTIREKYTLSASARLDQSNLFGVNSNQKGAPLFSAGLAWNIAKESFYTIDALPHLKVRLSYGYNGNINKSLSAYTTATYNTGVSNNNNTYTRLPFATVRNPPNPELSWERVKIINAAFEFGARNNRVNGTVEYFYKRGLDLIGDTPFPPSSGVTTFRGNTADVKGQGIDLQINTRNLVSSGAGYCWNTTLNASYNTDRVSHYAVEFPASYLLSIAANARQDYPIYGMYSYRAAGLDPATGDPQGYLDGLISKDYAKMRAAATPDNLVYHGPSRPTVFGALFNTFGYKGINLSVGLNYRFGHFFRKASISYQTVFTGLGGHGDYALRWQQTGDETTTIVPSMPAAVNANRDDFYLNSSALVFRADNIRLQDVRLSYDLNSARPGKLPFKSLQVYIYANNLGLIWKASKGVGDPEYQLGSPLRSVAAGVRMDLK